MKLILKLAVSGGILVFLFYRIDTRQFLSALGQTSIPLFLAAAVAAFLLLLLPAMSQRILFKGCHLNLDLTRIYEINLISTFYSLAVPGDIAAGIARFLKFSKAHRGPRVSEHQIRQSVLVVMGADRLLNMASLILPLPILLFFAPLPANTAWFQKSAILLTLGFLAVFILGRRFSHEKIRVSNFFSNMIEIFQSIPLKKFLTSFVICFLFQTAAILVVDILLAKSVGITLPWLQFFSIAAAVRFARNLPVTTAGIGVREGLFPLFLGMFGVPFETAVTMGLLGSLLVVLIGLVGGILEGYSAYLKR